MKVVIKTGNPDFSKANNLIGILSVLSTITESFSIEIKPNDGTASINEETQIEATGKIIEAFAENNGDCTVLVQKSNGAENVSPIAPKSSAKNPRQPKEKSSKEFFEELLKGKVRKEVNARELFSSINPNETFSEDTIGKMQSYLEYATTHDSDLINLKSMVATFPELDVVSNKLKIRNFISSLLSNIEVPFLKAPSVYEFLKAYKSVYESLKD